MKLNYGKKGRFSYYEDRELIVGSGNDTRGGVYFFIGSPRYILKMKYSLEIKYLKMVEEYIFISVKIFL